MQMKNVNFRASGLPFAHGVHLMSCALVFQYTAFHCLLLPILDQYSSSPLFFFAVGWCPLQEVPRMSAPTMHYSRIAGSNVPVVLCTKA